MPPPIAGTFEALGSPQVVEHLARLGVTAIELMPIQAFFDDRYLVEKGLANYWGYNTIGFFAPAPRYLMPGNDIAEFKHMVQRLHEAGIEVILDVVYNHTAEGNQLGPTLSFRGLDNASYYVLADDPRYYFDTTGCGNNVNLRHPRVLQMVMDSLRYWVEECHIDGFRFDLAVTLTRDRDAFDSNSPFLDAVAQDPVLAKVKMISESWDLGEYGYQVGAFPPGWAEWNGRFRDDMRGFVKGDAGDDRRLRAQPAGLGRHLRPPRPAAVGQRQLPDRPRRLHAGGSLQLQRQAQRGERRGQPRRRTTTTARGTAASRGRPTTRRSSRCATGCGAWRSTMLDRRQGMPMILMGDEIGRTQEGNNNAYCQDSPLAWMAWSPEPREAACGSSSPARCGSARELAAARGAALAARRAGRGGRAARGALAAARRRADDRGGVDERPRARR